MLTPLQKLALANISLTNEERKQIAPGKHEVSFTIEVKGTLDVADPESYVPTVDIPLIPTVALALKKMGIQRENFLALMRESMTEVLQSDKKMREALIKQSGLEAFEDDFRKTLGTLPKKTRVGKVKAAVIAKPR